VLGPAIFTLAEVLGATGILVTTTFTNQKKIEERSSVILIVLV
jgi:hypothetical protein